MFIVPTNFLFTVALDCIQGYRFLEPFSIYLKKYFQANTKLGARDRRNIRQLCYAWWRLGNAAKEYSNVERMFIALFLSYEQRDGLSERIFKEDELLNSLALHPKSKMQLLKQLYSVAIVPTDIFPLTDLIESELPLDDFINDGFLRRSLWVRINNKFEKETLAFFRTENIDFVVHPSSSLSVQLPADFDIIKAEPYLKGWIEIQDFSSQQVGTLYKPQPNEKWLDACAASGGKALQLLDMQPSVNVTVTDIRESILTNLHLRFKRNHISNYKSKVVDWSNVTTNSNSRKDDLFDAIIADVPCSGSGTWARTPEQKLFVSKEQLQQFSALQYAITSNLISVLKKGGALYYSTCSVYRNENTDVINQLLNNNAVELVDQKIINGIPSNADTMYLAKLIKK